MPGLTPACLCPPPGVRRGPSLSWGSRTRPPTPHHGQEGGVGLKDKCIATIGGGLPSVK